MSQTWVIFDMGIMCWREFYGSSQQDPSASIAAALIACGRYQDRFSAHRHSVYCFDKAPYQRSRLLASYKAGREAKERPPEEEEARRGLRLKIDELTQKLREAGENLVLSLVGYEADDHIASAVESVPARDHAVIISRDKDLYQLITPWCVHLDPVTDTITTSRRFRECYGVHPSEWSEVKALAGCSTDDIPGIPGVGEKTAIKYLTGRMNRLSVVYPKIRDFVGTDAHQKNLALCRLPFLGTPPVRLGASA